METVRWGEFRTSDEALSRHALERLQAAPCYLATVRPDGWPRVHPVGVHVRGDALVVVMYPTSPKRHDLDRGGMFALHCAVEDQQGGGGEVLVSGVAAETAVTAEDEAAGYVTYELGVGEVTAIRYEGSDLHPVRSRWTASS